MMEEVEPIMTVEDTNEMTEDEHKQETDKKCEAEVSTAIRKLLDLYHTFIG